MTGDLELLDAWREGDKKAGNELLVRHFDTVFRFFDRKVDDDPADLVQKTFLACVESRDRFQKRSSFRTFLFSIARHELYDYWRAKKRQPDLDFSLSSVADLAASPSAIAAKRGDQRLLLEALRAIPIDLQIAIELHYWQDMTGPQLAEVLDIPEPTVRSRLHRAREALRKQLGKLAASPQLRDSTMTNLESFMRSLRERSL